MRPPSTATSATKRGAPVPSTIVPLRITRSVMAGPPGFCSRGAGRRYGGDGGGARPWWQSFALRKVSRQRRCDRQLLGDRGAAALTARPMAVSSRPDSVRSSGLTVIDSSTAPDGPKTGAPIAVAR